MSTFVYMKVLEAAPEFYDRSMAWLSRGRIGRIYERIAERVAAPGRTVLDVGTGTGGVALACAARGARVIGIDRNAGMLDVARRKADAACLSERIDWIELGAMEIEDRIEPESIDAAVACLVVSELLEEERDYVLRTVYRSLRPGGTFVIADEVMSRHRVRAFLQSLRRLPAVVVTYLLTLNTTRPVVGTIAAMEAAGFEDVSETRLESDDFAIYQGIRPGGGRTCDA
jgi:ubiquinone/menaquinone biosynthesis C-methylase UbiE